MSINFEHKIFHEINNVKRYTNFENESNYFYSKSKYQSFREQAVMYFSKPGKDKFKKILY